MLVKEAPGINNNKVFFSEPLSTQQIHGMADYIMYKFYYCFQCAWLDQSGIISQLS